MRIHVLRPQAMGVPAAFRITEQGRAPGERAPVTTLACGTGVEQVASRDARTNLSMGVIHGWPAVRLRCWKRKGCLCS